MKLKRLFAFILDLFIVSLITSIIFSLPVFDKYNSAYTEAGREVLEYFNTIGSGSVDKEVLDNLLYKLTYTSRISSIIELAITILYFGVLQFVMNGQTLGKKLMKIQVQPNKGDTLNPGLFMLRMVILNNIIFNLITTIGLIKFDKATSLTINSYCSYGILIVNLLIIGTIIFRDDERGLHDLIANTKVVPIKKEK